MERGLGTSGRGGAPLSLTLARCPRQNRLPLRAALGSSINGLNPLSCTSALGVQSQPARMLEPA